MQLGSLFSISRLKEESLIRSGKGTDAILIDLTGGSWKDSLWDN